MRFSRQWMRCRCREPYRKMLLVIIKSGAGGRGLPGLSAGWSGYTKRTYLDPSSSPSFGAGRSSASSASEKVKGERTPGTPPSSSCIPRACT